MAERAPEHLLRDLRTDLTTLRAWTQDGLRALGAEMDRHLADATTQLDGKIQTVLRDPIAKLSERIVATEQDVQSVHQDLQRLQRRETGRLLEAQRQDRLLIRWTARWALLVVTTTLLTVGAFEIAKVVVGRWR